MKNFSDGHTVFVCARTRRTSRRRLAPAARLPSELRHRPGTRPPPGFTYHRRRRFSAPPRSPSLPRAAGESATAALRRHDGGEVDAPASRQTAAGGRPTDRAHVGRGDRHQRSCGHEVTARPRSPRALAIAIAAPLLPAASPPARALATRRPPSPPLPACRTPPAVISAPAPPPAPASYRAAAAGLYRLGRARGGGQCQRWTRGRRPLRAHAVAAAAPVAVTTPWLTPPE